MEFIQKKNIDGVEIVQLRSLKLLENASSLLNCYNTHILCRELDGNVNVTAEELQQNLLKISPSSIEELENRILTNVCKVVKIEPQCRLYEVFRRTIKADEELMGKIFSNNEYLRGSLNPKIRKLKAELTDTEFPLSPAGKERLTGFLDYFEELEMKLSKGEEKKMDPLSPTHQLEIKEYVIREFISRCSEEELVSILRREPKVEGLHAREVLVNTNSEYGVSPEQQKSCVFYLGCDFALANMLTTYPFELLFDKKKQLMLGFSHFLSVKVTCELNLMLSRYILEVLLGLRSHLVLVARKVYEEADQFSVIIRRKKNEDGSYVIQMICIDPSNENLFEDQTNEKIHTNVLLEVIKPIQEFLKEVFSKEDFCFEPNFLEDIEVEFENKGFASAKKIAESMVQCLRKDDSKFFESMNDRSPVHIFFEQWKKFRKDGEIKKEEGNEVSQKFDEKTPFFVYGTLRPDEDRSKYQWSEMWNNSDVKLRNRKGYIKNSDLFVGRYPYVKFTSEKERGKQEDWKDHIVFGYIQDFEPKVDMKKYLEKLRYLNQVEGYPNLYNRKIVKAYIIKEEDEAEEEGEVGDGKKISFDKKKITGDEESVGVHVYFIDKDIFSETTLVKSGDYIAFKKQKK